jgi:hypothetical protein
MCSSPFFPPHARRHTLRLQLESQPRNCELADRNVFTNSRVNPFHLSLVSIPRNSCPRHIIRVPLPRISQPRLSFFRRRRETPPNPRDEPWLQSGVTETLRPNQLGLMQSLRALSMNKEHRSGCCFDNGI